MSMASPSPFRLFPRSLPGARLMSSFGSKVVHSGPSPLMGLAALTMFMPGYFYANDASALLGMDRNVTDTPKPQSVISEEVRNAPGKAYQATTAALHNAGGAVRAWLPSYTPYQASPADLSSSGGGGGGSSGGGGGSPASASSPTPVAHRHPGLWRFFAGVRAGIEAARQGELPGPARLASAPRPPAERLTPALPSLPAASSASRPFGAGASTRLSEAERMPERPDAPSARPSEGPPRSMAEFDRRAALSPDFGQTVGMHVFGAPSGLFARRGFGGMYPHARPVVAFHGGFHGRR